jgi:hypothetical protein
MDVVFVWARRIVWLSLVIVGIWIISLAASNYTSCRAVVTNKIACVLITMLESTAEVWAFIAITVVKVLNTILP